MGIFVVSYDGYPDSSIGLQRLQDALNAVEHKKLQDGLWVVSVEDRSLDFEQYLYDIMGNDQLLFVAEVSRQPMYWRV